MRHNEIEIGVNLRSEQLMEHQVLRPLPGIVTKVLTAWEIEAIPQGPNCIEIRVSGQKELIAKTLLILRVKY